VLPCHVSKTRANLGGQLYQSQDYPNLVNILQAFPSWQLLLVDLRCHGESARLPTRPGGPHSLETSAGDILRLLGRLKLFPEVLIGHSFGGKVGRCSDLSSQSCLTIPQQGAFQALQAYSLIRCCRECMWHDTLRQAQETVRL